MFAPLPDSEAAKTAPSRARDADVTATAVAGHNARAHPPAMIGKRRRRSSDDYNDLPTARTTLRTGYVLVLVFCNSCRHQANNRGFPRFSGRLAQGQAR
jgi:hypothetical protein